MKLAPRSLYAKIFLWFCLTIGVSTSLVIVIAGVMGQQPFGRRWMAVTQDLYAHSAMDFYNNGGAPALSRYLASLNRSSGIEGHLLTAAGQDVLGSAFPAHGTAVYWQVQRTGLSASHLGRYWVAASAVQSADGQRFIFVMEAHPARGFLDGTFIFSAVPRLAAGLLLVALFCLLLARHITRPVRILQSAATRMAGGDLSVRTLPALGKRTDELAVMAAAFDSMAERIEGLLQTERQMLADISHELRSPLTRIAVSVELLRRGETDVIEPIQTDLDRLNQLIGQILQLSRFELQPPVNPNQQVELRELLADIVESAGYEGRHRKVSVHLAPSNRCVLPADEKMLRSCVENIVRNALQHSTENQNIAVSLDDSQPSVVIIRVEDAGPGVPAEALSRIFEPFFRVSDSSHGHPQGSGLGLSIAARIAARHGGSITAANHTPHGLCVTLTLPRP